MSLKALEFLSVLKADDIGRLDGVLDRNSRFEVLRRRLQFAKGDRRESCVNWRMKSGISATDILLPPTYEETILVVSPTTSSFSLVACCSSMTLFDAFLLKEILLCI